LSTQRSGLSDQRFQPGEEMPYYEFEKRFKEKYCGGIEPRLAQSAVKVLAVNGNVVAIAIAPKAKAE
jgi:hypothetical protein